MSCKNMFVVEYPNHLFAYLARMVWKVTGLYSNASEMAVDQSSRKKSCRTHAMA